MSHPFADVVYWTQVSASKHPVDFYVGATKFTAPPSEIATALFSCKSSIKSIGTDSLGREMLMPAAHEWVLPTPERIDEFRAMLLAPKPDDDPNVPRTPANVGAIVFGSIITAQGVRAKLGTTGEDGLISSHAVGAALGGINVFLATSYSDPNDKARVEFDANGRMIGTRAYQVLTDGYQFVKLTTRTQPAADA